VRRVADAAGLEHHQREPAPQPRHDVVRGRRRSGRRAPGAARAYDSLAALAASLQRSRVEPEGVRLPARRIAALIDHAERLMAHLSMVRLTLARLADDAQAPWPRIDGALAGAATALSEQLDPTAASAPSVAAAVDPSLALLPEQPAAHDVMPWLSRRLGLMVVEAARVRAAAHDLATD
jgi:hypothetical protein